jgi:hypothetical protein
MAKRTPRSDDDDPTTAVPPPQPAKPDRRRRSKREPGATSAQETAPARSDSMDSMDSMASEPSEEDIRHRAYQLYLERGGGHGTAFHDWLRAEQQLKKKTPAS